MSETGINIDLLTGLELTDMDVDNKFAFWHTSLAISETGGDGDLLTGFELSDRDVENRIAFWRTTLIVVGVAWLLSLPLLWTARVTAPDTLLSGVTSPNGDERRAEVRTPVSDPPTAERPADAAAGSPLPARQPGVRLSASGATQPRPPQALSVPPEPATGRSPSARPLPASYAEDPSTPSLSISGTVMDQHGRPVPGMAVVARARRVFETVLADGDEIVADEERRTVSGANGYYQLGRLVDGEYELRTDDLRVHKPARLVVRAGVESANLVVITGQTQQVWVYGDVVDDRGAALAGVSVQPLAQNAEVAYTDDAGSYGLYLPLDDAQRARTIRFQLDGYRVERKRLAAAQLQDSPDLYLDAQLQAIEEYAAVDGTLAGADGLPVAAARLRLYSRRLGQHFRAASDDGGRFRFAEVPLADDYQLQVRPRAGYKDYREEKLRVGRQGLSLALTLEPLDHGSISGYMINHAGDPVPGFSLWLHNNETASQPPRLVTGDQSGYFSVDEVPAGRLRFATRSAPYFSVSGVELFGGDVQDVHLVLDWGDHELHGQVLDAAGQPVASAQTALSWAYRENGLRGQSTRRAVADTQGYFQFTRLGPGRHLLTVSAPGFENTRVEQEIGHSTGVLTVRLQESTF